MSRMPVQVVIHATFSQIFLFISPAFHTWGRICPAYSLYKKVMSHKNPVGLLFPHPIKGVAAITMVFVSINRSFSISLLSYRGVWYRRLSSSIDYLSETSWLPYLVSDGDQIKRTALSQVHGVLIQLRRSVENVALHCPSPGSYCTLLVCYFP